MSTLKKWAAIVLGALVALALAFSAGRFSKPSEVIEAHVFHAFAVEKVVEKIVVEKAKAQVVYVDRTITKEGAVHEVVVTKTVEAEKTVADRTADKLTDTSAKAETITKNDAPRLTVMVLAGVDLKPAWQPITGAGPLALGIAVNYRIAGPLVVGAWGVHTGAFGVGVGAQF